MKVTDIKTKGTWREVADAARTTIHMDKGDKEVKSSYIRKMLLSEHSPMRKFIVTWKWRDLKSWVSVHFVRHKFGIEHWVRTQRTDRTGIDRGELPQGNFVEHECEANSQAIITISRNRLCKQASKETTEAWQEFLSELSLTQPELFSVCVPDCVYRGHCFEFKSCGFHKTEAFKELLQDYREGINE